MNERCSIEGILAQAPFVDAIVHRCDSNPGASGGPLFGQFEDGNYYIVGLHSGNIPLNVPVQLSNGDRTQAINRGVQVSRWSTSAGLMR